MGSPAFDQRRELLVEDDEIFSLDSHTALPLSGCEIPALLPDGNGEQTLLLQMMPNFSSRF
jgi:hypothetical protein